MAEPGEVLHAEREPKRALEAIRRAQGSLNFSLYTSQPNPLEFAEPLTGYDMYRFRVGDYRVAFQIDQNIMYIKSVRHRGKAYRRM